MERITLEGEPVRVPPDVLKGLEAVRQSGATNMVDRPAVVRLARMMGHDEAADWIEANRGLYSEAVFRGFSAVE